MNFTWSYSFGNNIIQYAPSANISINVTTGCAQLSLNCSSSAIDGVAATYTYYTNGVSFYGAALATFSCNGAAQLWQNNYLNQSIDPITATNFICYGAAPSGRRSFCLQFSLKVYIYSLTNSIRPQEKKKSDLMDK
jgi:hypothetical protein